MHSKSEVALAEAREKQELLLDPAQNTEPNHNMSIQCVCPEDVEGPVVSAFIIKVLT